MTSAPPPAAQARLFLGLWPTPAQRAATQAAADAWRWPAAARRTAPERLHATLHFIGEVAAHRLPELQQALSFRWEGCELAFDRAEVWPGGIAVLEAGAVPPSLVRLHARLGEALAGLQLPVESRRYRPHVTLARKALGARPPPDGQALHWSIGPGYVLVQSLPGGRGYVPLQCFG